jgi:transposase
MSADAYPSDLNDAEWSILQPLLVPTPQAGHPQMHELRWIIDAVLYLLRTGCQWRAIPHEFPPWSTVYYHYAKWRRDGTRRALSGWLRTWRGVD